MPGFNKAELERTAAEVRGELGHGPLDPLNTRALCDLLALPVQKVSDFVDANPSIAVLLGPCASQFSACTIHLDRRRLIIVNDAHELPRIASSLAHECSHAILGHPPGSAFDGMGCRSHNKQIEDEASWLAGALLVTSEAALRAERFNDAQRMAASLGVSEQMMQYRINVTGAGLRVKRERAKRR